MSRTQLNEPKSLLTYVTEADVITTPYPHIVIKDILAPDLMKELMNTFPQAQKVAKKADFGSNRRYDYTIADLRKDNELPPIWKQFIEAQAGQQFFDDFIRIFNKSINQYYPDLAAKYQNWTNLKLGTRYINSHDQVDLLADAHISVNTPVTDKPNSVRASHVDDPKKFYGGLLYMRLPEDNSTGGDLEISRLKNPKAKFFGQGLKESDVEVVNEIKYANNTFVLFLNTIDSIHGVTPRSITPHTRQFINLVAEFKEPLFDITSRQENIWVRRAKVLKSKIFG